MDPESDREQPSNSVVNYLTSAEKPIRVGNVNFYRAGLFTGKGYLQGRAICISACIKAGKCHTDMTVAPHGDHFSIFLKLKAEDTHTRAQAQDLSCGQQEEGLHGTERSESTEEHVAGVMQQEEGAGHWTTGNTAENSTGLFFGAHHTGPIFVI